MVEERVSSQAEGEECPYRAAARVFPVDQETPITAFLKLRPLGAHTLLESVEGDEKVARFSFIAVGAVARLEAGAERAVLRGEWGTMEASDPTPLLRRGWRLYRAETPPGVALPYTGGAVGYLAYDYVRTIERLPRRHPPSAPVGYWVWPHTVVAFDHRQQTLTVMAQAHRDQSPGVLAERLDAAVAALSQPHQPVTSNVERRGPVVSNLGPARYEEMVERARRYIEAGDIFQVVLSQKLSAPVTGDPFGLYRRLRRLNPSPYLFYMETGERTLVGSSPELLVRVHEGDVFTRPIAGTRPRGATPEADRQLWEDLVTDEKERAEHVMLVDLGRNDIGRVAVPGTVRVTRLMAREVYSHVMHMVSDVSGRLGPGLDALDALRACFPAGTLTGAPKIRAMEIIEELEPESRGAYGGVVGYLAHGGSLDAAITIRTLEICGGRATVQAGGGIVADSVPEREYQESLNKARALIAVLDGDGKDEWR
jgi:anthranilate synthase component 1